jgi:hypothetical protein
MTTTEARCWLESSSCVCAVASVIILILTAVTATKAMQGLASSLVFKDLSFPDLDRFC